MAGAGLTLQDMTDDELRQMAQSTYERSLAIERQKMALDKELDRLGSVADGIVEERDHRGIASLLNLEPV